MELLHQPENDSAPLDKGKKHIVVQKENYQLENTGTEQQFRGTVVEEIAYNAVERRSIYYKTESAYDENRITEKAFNDRTEENSNMPENAERKSSMLTPPEPSDSPSVPQRADIGMPASNEEYRRYVNITDQSFGLWKNAADIESSGDKLEELDKKRKEVQRVYARAAFHGSAGDITKKRLIFNNYRNYGRIRLITDSPETENIGIVKAGRLEAGVQIKREKITRKDMDERIQKAERKYFEKRAAGRLMFRKGVSLINDDNISEDEDIADIKRTGKRAMRGAAFLTRKSARILVRNNNVYARYELEEMRHKALESNHARLMSQHEKNARKQQLREIKSKEEKKKLKKKMVQQRAREEGNFFTRTKNQMNLKKTSYKYKQLRQKRFLTSLFSTFILVLFFIILAISAFLIFVAATSGGSEMYIATVTQNDYETLTDATVYLKGLEADLDERLVDREAFEAELDADYGPDIYEYIYNLAPLGFSCNSLTAYLSAVYGSFTLDSVRSEIDDIFSEMYHLEIMVKMEDREVRQYNSETNEYEIVTVKKKICYVTLEKTELEDVIEGRLPEELKFQYSSYWLSSGGQQVYAPVMKEDWTNRISSGYGERIHPISHERKFHKGVDIAVPEGTKLYSAVKGVVTKSNYSESAGNQVTVQTDSGWTVTFMHMSLRAVSVGQQVEQGDFLGLSGNTGNSTGPHLHLQVADADEKTINPVFIIPQSCAALEGEED